MKTKFNISIPTSRLHVMGVLCLVVLTITSCKKSFENINTDPVGIADKELISDYNDLKFFFQMEQRSVVNFSGGGDPNSYQVQQSLNADNFSGYFMAPNPFNGGNNNTNYFMVQGWNGEAFKVGYLNIMANVRKLKNNGIDQTYPSVWAVSQLIKVTAMSRVTDIYGPIPYSTVGLKVNNPYDSQKDVYYQFFTELDDAQKKINDFVSAGKTLPFNFKEFDLVYDGNLTTWLKYANSLRLRLALRLVKVDPAKARLEGEKAMNLANGGLLSTPADNMAVKVLGTGFSNPLVFISKDWGDTRMGAAIESYLSGYADPRLPKYFDKATDKNVAGQYKGIRIGANIASKDDYVGYSGLNVNDGTPTFSKSSSVQLMTAAEVYFLRAEAALRGWANAGGSAQSLYESGVNTSFQQYGLGDASAYLANNTNVPAAYLDPRNAANNAASPTSVTVKWDESASNELKLERIITQKWLAIFPEGQEAWSEFRRTGYPKLFPVVQNNSGGTIITDIQIRRLPFPQNERNTNSTELDKGIQLLGGPDNGGTRLWWDVAKGNF
ncbi:SusD/RagB family nutrient-binding outer membrane lipoprotein [Pedobacter sp. PAMC26386]|nr:SusD/RagB family nutrient-binding outer membrane lipoprotein [Pedobacter sp. PAMC26386]